MTPNKAEITPHLLRMVISQHLASGSGPVMADDPPQALFTEEIIAPGGPHLVLTGPNSQAADVTRWFLKRIALRLDHASFQEKLDLISKLDVEPIRPRTQSL